MAREAARKGALSPSLLPPRSLENDCGRNLPNKVHPANLSLALLYQFQRPVELNQLAFFII
jgi:hypothetical protein